MDAYNVQEYIVISDVPTPVLAVAVRIAARSWNRVQTGLESAQFSESCRCHGRDRKCAPGQRRACGIDHARRGQETHWISGNTLNYRRDGLAKVTGQKVFAIDLRARDMQGWPDKQSHALTIHIPRADRIYEGLDLSVLGSDYQPDVLIDAESIAADGLRMPDPGFYGEFFVKKGQVSPMLGHPVAVAIWHDYEKFRVANQRLRFNDAIFRFGAEAAQPPRAPYGRALCARTG